MSRIGKMPIAVPAGVTLTRADDGVLTVKGPKGELSRALAPDIAVRVDGAQVLVERPTDSREHRSQHGLVRTLVANMVEGVTKGYERMLEVHGVGYRASVNGNALQLSVGYSHPVEVAPRPGISFAVANDPQSRVPVITVSGIDKEKVGQIAAEIRKMRKPEPYKGKGIRYRGEVVRRKAGKAGAKGAKK